MTGTDWQQRLDAILEMMVEMSRHTDPQAMVQAYGKRVREIVPRDHHLSLSRRGLEYPWFRITRFSGWQEEINPWQEPHRLPLLSGGVLADLLYSNRPQLISPLELAADDPAAPYLAGQRSLASIPMFDDGEALNMVVFSRGVEDGFDPQTFPETFWMASLFGRATHNLVLRAEVQRAFQAVDRELKVVSGIQRSLLPTRMPEIANLQLAAFYETSQRAGGDYYDFFPLAGGRWGILIADVSGHGTPAAVVMAVTHSIAHLFPGKEGRPGELLEFVNRHLSKRYTGGVEAFVTAFYGVYDPATRQLAFSCAGHNPPRLRRRGESLARELETIPNLPLGIVDEMVYEDQSIQLQVGDRLVLYTDGISEAMSEAGEEFGVERLDRAFQGCEQRDPEALLDQIMANVREFTAGAPVSDDRTLVVAVVQ